MTPRRRRFRKSARQRQTRKESEPYIRHEDDSVKAYYRVQTPFYEESPDRIRGVVRVLKKVTGLSPSTVIFPAEIDELQIAAGAFVEAIETCFGTRLGFSAEDLARIDRTVDRFLLDPALDSMAKRYHKRLDEFEDYGKLAADIHVPRETLFYYCLGAYYGELLVKLRHAIWRLYPPLAVMQVFPDVATHRTSLCAFPFSHVVRKMCDPLADRLSFKANMLSMSTVRCQPPFALAASMADVERVWADLLGPAAATALRLGDKGKLDVALDKLTAELDRDDGNCHILVEASQIAYTLSDLDLVYRLCERALELAPSAFNHHNFAVVLSHKPERRREAISHASRSVKYDPGYSRARITLAALYLEEKRIDAAKEQLSAVVTSEVNKTVREEAEQLLKSLERRTPDPDKPVPPTDGS
jgi:tetratricopeptide (TPR) repeat protein